MRILAISGSLRSGSHNTALLRNAAEDAPAGVELQLWDGLRAIPPYDADDDVAPRPAAVEAFRAAVRDADAVLIATPEYNSSIPGVLKNALDWASRPLETSPFRNKPVATIGSSTGTFGAVWSQAELRKVLGAMGARVADVELAVSHAHEKLDDHATRVAVRDAVSQLVALTRESIAAAAR